VNIGRLVKFVSESQRFANTANAANYLLDCTAIKSPSIGPAAFQLGPRLFKVVTTKVLRVPNRNADGQD
jgi:hypothetical protein